MFSNFSLDRRWLRVKENLNGSSLHSKSIKTIYKLTSNPAGLVRVVERLKITYKR